jgi:hypothetical protein
VPIAVSGNSPVNFNNVNTPLKCKDHGTLYPS